VKIFDVNGNYLKKFETKINPGAIYFYRWHLELWNY
jgi:hypothetical protein